MGSRLNFSELSVFSLQANGKLLLGAGFWGRDGLKEFSNRKHAADQAADLHRAQHAYVFRV